MIFVLALRPLLVSHITAVSSSDGKFTENVPPLSCLKTTPTSFPIDPHSTLEISHSCAMGSVHFRVHRIIPFLQLIVRNDRAIRHLDGSALEKTHARSILHDFQLVLGAQVGLAAWPEVPFNGTVTLIGALKPTSVLRIPLMCVIYQ